MHPSRWNVLLRIALGVLLMAAPVVWYSMQEPPARPSMRQKRMEKSYLPNEGDMRSLRGAVADLSDRSSAPQPMSLDARDMGLLACPGLSSVEAPQQALVSEDVARDDVSLLFMSAGNRMAMINGRLYAEGWQLPDGRRVSRITPRGVLLMADGRQQFVPWEAPMRVKLVRQAQQGAEDYQEPEAVEENSEPPLQDGEQHP